MVTDKNGLIYMRARYYSPQLRRFINADILPGSIANAVTLNRFAYANGNPVSYIDPFGLNALNDVKDWLKKAAPIAKKGLKSAFEVSSAIYHNAGGFTQAIIAGNAFDWTVDKFKELTREGKLDNTIDFFIGVTPDEKGIYHIAQDYWQSTPIVGYNDFYDKAFDFGVGLTGYTVEKRKFEFAMEDGTEYVIWMWKGDYTNLGSGAEAGIYKKSTIPGHWLTSAESSMPMSLKLQQIDTGEVLFDYHPSENQWWINGFDPSNQNAYAHNLALTVTIDFTGNSNMYEAFQAAWAGKGWTYDDMKATYNWRK